MMCDVVEAVSTHAATCGGPASATARTSEAHAPGEAGPADEAARDDARVLMPVQLIDMMAALGIMRVPLSAGARADLLRAMRSSAPELNSRLVSSALLTCAQLQLPLQGESHAALAAAMERVLPRATKSQTATMAIACAMLSASHIEHEPFEVVGLWRRVYTTGAYLATHLGQKVCFVHPACVLSRRAADATGTRLACLGLNSDLMQADSVHSRRASCISPCLAMRTPCNVCVDGMMRST